MSLRLRLTLAFVVGTAVLIVVAAFAFLSQLSSSLTSALDATLQAQLTALTTQLAKGPQLPAITPVGGQTGNQQGQAPRGAEQLTQVLSRQGAVLYPSGEGDPGGTLLPALRVAEASQKHVGLTTMFEGEQYRVLAGPAQWHGRPVVAVVAVATDVAVAGQARARMVIGLGGVPAVIVAGLGAWLLTGAALRTVDRMRRRLEEITEHDLTARLDVPPTGDELAALARTMNDLLNRLQQALARQRAFVADAGHELRTPLTALKAELELAARSGQSRSALQRAIAASAGDTDRLIRLAENLLALARGDQESGFAATDLVDIRAELLAAARSFDSQARQREVTISVQADEQLTGLASRDRLRQAVANLLDNAIRHAPKGSVVELTGRVGVDAGRLRGAGGRRTVEIAVRDHGPGFPPDFLPDAFERFSRADSGRGRTEGGSGLGLAIVESIARAHGGRAVAENHPDGGARVRMIIVLAPVSGEQHGPAGH